MWRRLVSLLYPETCPSCGTGGTALSPVRPLCENCWERLVPFEGAQCQVCGLPLPSEQARRCGECVRNPPAFDLLSYHGLYEGTLREAVHLLKYRGHRHLALPLASLLRDRVPRATAEICPVPLHVRRLREREYNQSFLLARELGAALAIPVVPDRLRRVRETPPQVGLGRKERLRNVRGSIAASETTALPTGRIVVVDDVGTTGATARACAEALRRAGARAVTILVLARDDPSGDVVVA